MSMPINVPEFHIRYSSSETENLIVVKCVMPAAFSFQPFSLESPPSFRLEI